MGQSERHEIEESELLGFKYFKKIRRLLDMLRTVVNITGDAVTAVVVVAKSENEWDQAISERQNPEERQHRQGD
jgi:Na+/H+-dicarboxylate symporter